ncbi:MAG: hypothetical protein FJ280_17265 [Planctomycetes bacterium]|nr:hypothetical protein [Planctomycetota bacterium]
MRSPITKLAAAAAVIVALVLFLGLWGESTPPAYALEQTVEANQNVRWLHMKNFTVGQEEPQEAWIEFGTDGQARQARAQTPDWASPVDGAWVLTWRDDTVQRWTKRENRLHIAKADKVREQLNAVLQETDPRRVVAHVAELEQQGKVEIVTEESPDKTKPIAVTVTYLPGSDKPGQRKVLSVDPETKLVNAMGLFRLKDGQYCQEGRIKLREYNQPIDGKVFDLTNEVPANTERLDFTNMGLAQGQLGDEEAAIQVVRQFFESLMAGDYDAAGRLLPVGAAAVKEQFGRVKILRIVSVGPGVALSEPGKNLSRLRRGLFGFSTRNTLAHYPQGPQSPRRYPQKQIPIQSRCWACPARSSTRKTARGTRSQFLGSRSSSFPTSRTAG